MELILIFLIERKKATFTSGFYGADDGISYIYRGITFKSSDVHISYEEDSCVINNYISNTKFILNPVNRYTRNFTDLAEIITDNGSGRIIYTSEVPTFSRTIGPV